MHTVAIPTDLDATTAIKLVDITAIAASSVMTSILLFILLGLIMVMCAESENRHG